MKIRNQAVVCVAVAVALALPVGVFGQTTNGTGMSQAQIDQILSSLGGSANLGNLSGLLGSLTGNQQAAGSPATQAIDERVGPPSRMISAAIAQHQAFIARGFLTPAQRRAQMPQDREPIQIRLPITVLIPVLANLLGDHIPALSWLSGLFDGLIPDVPGGGDATPPAGKTGEGVVAFLTADDTTLAVGQETTVRLWVQQSSPNEAEDNGIFSVAANVVASRPGIVESQVPVDILSGWDQPTIGGDTGTVTVNGGIQGVTAGVPVTNQDRTRGLEGPVEVFNFTVKAIGSGTVTLRPANYEQGGFTGIMPFVGDVGDPENYVPVEITVTQ